MASTIAGRLIFIIMLVIGGILIFDIREHGSFKASKTGSFLKESGALHYGEIAFTKFRSYSQQGYRWCQANVPVYLTKARETAGPHLRAGLYWLASLAQQLWANVKQLCEYFWEKKPTVEKWINQYAPGLVDIVGSWLRQAWDFLREYSALLVNLLVKYLTAAAQWLRENVFIGSLSPENLQRYTMDALNTTQQLASQTFSWLNDKVVTIVSAS